MKINNATLELVQGDITTQDVDAIVNAANCGLAGGGGVDGAIHRAGGAAVMEECRALRGCPTGEARITGGGNLRARYVIHAVGPIYNNGVSGEAEKLTKAYRNSLKLAAENGVKSIAFPSLSTGAYRYPVTLAAKVALQEVARFLQAENSSIELVRFVLFDSKTYDAYNTALNALTVTL
ncbi:MAG TPA: O-acetyl-ADP-ribose deacetylase [Abditibacteriaceae bacterium]|jgi:O-acetyl-ADP-ribose deacetylase (regulator of RNase III)